MISLSSTLDWPGLLSVMLLMFGPHGMAFFDIHAPPPQVITVFFGSFIVGSFFSQFNQWIDNPTSAVNLIGTAVPQVGTASPIPFPCLGSHNQQSIHKVKL
jgi:hypothetical protein